MALILVAEDAPDIAGMLRDILQTKGHQVAIATDGVEMIERAKSIRPKLIVSDVMMPGAYGSSAYKSLQDDEFTKGIPVLFLTAITPEQAAKVIPKEDKIKVLHKPLDLPVFLAAIDELLALG
jgi:CheY-like chemotaxis protein